MPMWPTVSTVLEICLSLSLCLFLSVSVCLLVSPIYTLHVGLLPTPWRVHFRPFCFLTSLLFADFLWSDWLVSLLVSWCFEPSQPHRITSGLNTNFTLSPSYSIYKSSYHKSCFLSLFIFRGHSTWEPASSSVNYSILRAYIETGVSHSGQRKKIRRSFEKNASEWTGRVEVRKEEIRGSKRNMYVYILTYYRL